MTRCSLQIAIRTMQDNKYVKNEASSLNNLTTRLGPRDPTALESVTGEGRRALNNVCVGVHYETTRKKSK